MDTAAKIDTLRGSNFFRKVPSSDLRAFAESLRVEYFTKGQTLCEEGEPADRIFIVASGLLEVKLKRSDGNLPRIGVGGIVGEYGLFTHFRTATVVCVEDSVLLSLENERFNEFLILFPGTTYALLDQTVQTLVQAEKEFAILRGKTNDKGAKAKA